MSIKKILFCSAVLMACYFTSFGMQKVKISYFVTFKKDDGQVGRWQDLKTLDQLETMALESFISLQHQKLVFSSDAFERLKEARKVINSQEEIVIDKEVIKDFVRYIIDDGGKIEFWSLPDKHIADEYVKLIDRREASIFIEGPILDIARKAKFVKQKPTVKQASEQTSSESWWSEKCSIQ